MKRLTIIFVFLTALNLCPALSYALAPVSPETESIYSRASRIVSYEVPYKHLNRLPCDDSIAINALSNFIQALDFDRTYFLASDIEEFNSKATKLDDRLKVGDYDIAYEIYDVLMERVSNRVEYVSELLEEGFDLDIDESYQWRRKDQPWAANEEEWNELWRKKIKNQYVGKIVGKTLEEEEAEKKKAEEAESASAALNTDVTANSEAETTLSEKATAQVTIPAGLSEEVQKNKEPVESEATSPSNTVLTSELQTKSVDTNGAVDGITRESDKNSTIASTNGITAPADLTPEEALVKEYTQYLSVLNDNDVHWLVPLYISSFVHAYDPHSDYMSQNNTEDFDISMKLSLVGIGALLSTEDGAAKVVRLIPGGPAEQDGRLQAGDKIIAVAQGDEEPVDILHWPLSKSVRLIRGEKDTKVVLHVIPASDFSGTSVKKIDIIRDEVKLEERAAKGRIETIIGPDKKEYTVGVITIPDFYADINAKNDKEARSLTRDVKEILSDLTASNDVQGLLLDLRNNGGGSLPEAIDLTGLFIGSGPVVQVKNEGNVYAFTDNDPVTYYDGPLVIMVNRQSASASEIFAGALQDYGRAVLVGDSKTHGKGTVQSLFPLRQYNPKLGSLKLTTASYYRIAGGSTQKKGITPDIIIPSVMDSMEIGEEYLPGALEWSVVDPAFYTHSDVLGSIVPELQDRSIQRRKENQRFQAYKELLDYLSEKRQSKSIPLQLAQRLPMARRENEMAEYISNVEPDDTAKVPDAPPQHEISPPLNTSEKAEQEPADPQGANEESSENQEDKQKEEEKQNDLILDESLNILVDLINLQNNSKPEDTAPADSTDPVEQKADQKI